ncbi:MAG: hydroxylamine reductase [Candidatus Margulisbacteria bacterium GWF2_38_17]|nr:MAG: hydroxylamine reductase [Candidatus Margulisbacteria bacterium GWF2_38_17]
MTMFCYQCEQAAKGQGCTLVGTCGKTPEVSALQDLIIENLKGIAAYAKRSRELGFRDKEVDKFVVDGLFTTITNVDFDPQRLESIIAQSQIIKTQIKEKFLRVYKEIYTKEFSGYLPAAAYYVPAAQYEELVIQAEKFGIMSNKTLNEDVRSLKELLKYGLKGMAAYAHHASVFGQESEAVLTFIHKGLDALADDSLDIDALIALNLELGKVNLTCMEILDKGHTDTFGHPTPTEVFTGVKKGPAILVSGHDLLDLLELLKQTEGKGINVYTHGEMLPAHGYPGLKKYSHLVGNYGGAWQEQQKEFDAFPGAIIMTTNCIQKPKGSYFDRIFTTGLVAWPGVKHINDRNDFGVAIEKALALGGFKEDKNEKNILVGFGHNAVLSVADKVIGAVKAGKIKHFLLIGGCDGAKPGRNYYTDLAAKAPEDTVILTLACGKFRFNKLDFGTVEGIPRLLDIGQCNDAYSAIKIASALAEAFECGVNDLPLSIVLSWYEQKAVCILLTLFSLGIKNIKLGPTLPAFVSPNVLNVLVKNFNIQPIKTAEEDLEEILLG